jgi:hypothetical protein
LQIIRDGLEEAPWELPAKTPLASPDKDEPDSRRVQAIILDCEVPAAAQWLTIAASSIWKWTKAGERGDSKEDDSDLWEGKKGFNSERWAFWKERLVAIQGLDVASSTKMDTAEALKSMKAMEGS